MPDPIFQAAEELANQYGPAPIPAWLGDSRRCADVVERVEHQGIRHIPPAAYLHAETLRQALDQALTAVATQADSAPDLADGGQRKNVLLRLWFGCLTTGKTIALETRDGANTETVRRNIFNGVIEPLCAKCPVYKAGSRAAYEWKTEVRKQPVDFTGVPVTSAVYQRYLRLGSKPA